MTMRPKKRQPPTALARLLYAKALAHPRPVDEITEQAGVSRTSFYNWMDGAEPPSVALMLLKPVLRFTDRELREALLEDHAATAAPSGPPADADAAQQRLGGRLSGRANSKEAAKRRPRANQPRPTPDEDQPE